MNISKIMRNSKQQILIILMVISTLILSVVSPIKVYGKNSNSTSSDTTIPRVINIVYDDSGSMVPANKNDQRWCSAMYALEVFTAMMGEKDVINIYRMSEYDSSSTATPVIKTIKGNESTRVNQVHNMECDYYGTPFKAVQVAADDLKKVSKDNDRWLVILTDGDSFFFEDINKYASAKDTTARLTEALNEYSKEYKVAYLGIGAQAASIPSGPSNLNTWTARTGDEILTNVTEIANSIFEHQILSDNHIDVSGNGYTLTTDIPTSQIIIFAQGEDVSIGDLSLNGKKISGEQLNVKYCDEGEKGFPKSTRLSNFNTPDVSNYRNLKGVVAVFDAGEEPFADGSFEVDISGAAKTEIYYKAGVVPTCILYDEDGNIVDSEDGISAGEYTVEIGFINPLTGKAVSSDMLNVVNTEVSVINNGNELDISSGRIILEEGDAQIATSIELEGNVKAESFLEYKIKPKAIKLEILLDIPEEAYKAQQLNENAPPVIATLMDNTTGEVITAEQWDACKVKVSGNKDDKYIDWDIRKGKQQGTFEIRPIGKSDKNTTKIESGKHYFEMEVNLKTDEQKIEEKASGNVLIEAYEGTSLVIVSETVDTPVRIPAIKDFPGIKATVYMLDDTGQQVPISEDIWNCLKIKYINPKTKRVDWTLEKGSETGTYIVKPGYPWGLSLFMYGAVSGREACQEFTAPDGIIVNKASTITTGLRATGELGPLNFSGEGNVEMRVAPLTWKEIWALVWKYVVAFVAFMIILIGTLTKKRIQRGLEPHIVYGKNEVDCAIHYKRVLIPYIPERAHIENCDSQMKCNIADMYIEAVTNTSFRILNAEEIVDPPVKIKGMVFGPNDADRLAARQYGYNGYNMTPIGKLGKRMGMFHMTTTKK